MKMTVITIQAAALMIGCATTQATVAPAPYEKLCMEFNADTGTAKSIRVDGVATMNWIGFHGRWGEPSAKGRKLLPANIALSPTGSRAVWSDGTLAIEVNRAPSADARQWRETYRFCNLSAKPLSFKPADLAIRVPFADDYKAGAKVCLTERCHAHLWAEGNSAWICAQQMNGNAPHLGLLLTQGALDGYSIADREWGSNDRGAFIVHPAVTEIPANGSAEISWTLFSHQGWDDFFAKAKTINPGFIKLSAERYTVPLGEPLRITAESSTSLEKAQLLVNGKPVETEMAGGRLTCVFTPAVPGEQVVELLLNGRREKLVALVTPKVDDILRARAEFLMTKKQLLDPKSPHDGAYPVLDLETGKFVLNSPDADHNTARERMGSGAFIGLMWQRTPDGEFRDRLKVSFLRFYAFINREVQNAEGVVVNGVGAPHIRLYNYPLAAASHLRAWDMTHDKACLQRLMANLRDLYGKRNGAHFYVICQPISETLRALKEAGMETECQEVLGMFQKHAAAICKTGINIPGHEVNYEQSIMGPAMQITAETAMVTGDATFLATAETFRPMLEAFGGQQPHYRLHDIGIRHWDGFWFGKPRTGGRLYGDVMPHYWSTITAEAFRFYAVAAKRPEYFARAHQILLANLSQFDADGAGHCAYLYPRSINGIPGQYQDPYDNDQDWTLVHYLLFERMRKTP